MTKKTKPSSNARTDGKAKRRRSTKLIVESKERAGLTIKQKVTE